MDASLLFRKKSAMVDEGLPWLHGSECHPWTAKRNGESIGRVSAILMRSLIACLRGNVISASRFPGGVLAQVESMSNPGSNATCWWDGNTVYIPHGEENKVTYHIGVLAIIQVLAERTGLGPAVLDFLEVYADLLAAYNKDNLDKAIKPALCRAANELYYILRYAGQAVDAHTDRLPRLRIGDTSSPSPSMLYGLSVAPLTDDGALRALIATLKGTSPAIPAPTPAPITAEDMESPAESNTDVTLQPISQPLSATIESKSEIRPPPSAFIGWQLYALTDALEVGENILLAGPTGTGKTMAVHQAVLQLAAMTLITVEGKEGLTDLDFLGAVLPQPDGSRRWVDGPILRAMRIAQTDPVLLFLDEVNRVPRVYLNLLLGLMNPKTSDVCHRMGLNINGNGPYYAIEVPLTSEVVCCPTAHLRIVAAGNLGRAYQVYDLDPAVRRRFDTVVEFDYLPFEQEIELVVHTTGLSNRVSETLVRAAQETRRLMSNGELPGCIDTASLLNWGRKCARYGAGTIADVMKQARLVWADLVCGRDHTGRINDANLKAIQDYLVSLNTGLPQGKLDTAF